MANLDALKELEFKVDRVHHIIHVLKTITSNKLAVIVLNPKNNHYNHKNTWDKLDTELCALSDHASGPRRESDGSGLRLKLFLKSKDPNCNFIELAGRLIPQFVRRRTVTVFGAVAEKWRNDPEYLIR